MKTSATRALNQAVTRMLTVMSRKVVYPSYLDNLPILGVDGSLATVTDFQSDPTLAGATGQVRAKTGTYTSRTDTGLLLKARALADFVITTTGRRLAFQLVVDDVDDAPWPCFCRGTVQHIALDQDVGVVLAVGGDDPPALQEQHSAVAHGVSLSEDLLAPHVLATGDPARASVHGSTNVATAPAGRS